MSEIEQLNQLVGNLVVLIKAAGGVAGVGTLAGIYLTVKRQMRKDPAEKDVACTGGLSSEEKRQLTEIHLRSVEQSETQQSMAHEMTRLTAAVDRLADRAMH